MILQLVLSVARSYLTDHILDQQSLSLKVIHVTLVAACLSYKLVDGNNIVFFMPPHRQGCSQVCTSATTLISVSPLASSRAATTCAHYVNVGLSTWLTNLRAGIWIAKSQFRNKFRGKWKYSQSQYIIHFTPLITYQQISSST